MINVWLNIRLMYVSVISKADVHCASGTYKIVYECLNNFGNIYLDHCAKLHNKIVPFTKQVYMNDSSQIPNVIDNVLLCQDSPSVFQM